jgi:hypothetical protein
VTNEEYAENFMGDGWVGCGYKGEIHCNLRGLSHLFIYRLLILGIYRFVNIGRYFIWGFFVCGSGITGVFFFEGGKIGIHQASSFSMVYRNKHFQ